MPAELQTLEVSEYGTNQPIKLCDTDSCACDPGYMIATLGETNFCIEEFFLSSGGDNYFPNCQAMCCQSTCSKCPTHFVNTFQTTKHTCSYQ